MELRQKLKGQKLIEHSTTSIPMPWHCLTAIPGCMLPFACLCKVNLRQMHEKDLFKLQKNSCRLAFVNAQLCHAQDAVQSKAPQAAHSIGLISLACGQ